RSRGLIPAGARATGERSERPLHRLRPSPSIASQGRNRSRGRPQRWILPCLRGRGTMRSMVEGVLPTPARGLNAMKAQPKASHYINGRFVDDEQGQPLEVIYPATGEVIARLHAATENIVELAIESARTAQEQWARMRPTERGRILRRAADLLYARNDEIARLETLDTGKPVQETTVADPASAAEVIEFFGGVVAG